MAKYSEETYSKVELKQINEEDFNEIVNIYSVEEQNKGFLKGKAEVSIISFYYSKNSSFGIYYDDELVGIITAKPFIMDMVELRTLVLSEYRGKGIAQVAREKVVNKTGNMFSKYKKYVCLVHPNNINSNRSLINIGWKRTDELDEAMIEEGAEWFNVYIKNNPFYKKEMTKKLVNNYD